MGAWISFFQGELGAGAALAGLLFVSVSVNQARILELGRIADRGLEALVMLFMVIVIASLGLIPGQACRLLGGEVLASAILTLVVMIPLQRGFMSSIADEHRHNGWRMIWLSCATVLVVAAAGAVLLWRGDDVGLYILPAGILLTFGAVGANAWVLLIEINR